MKVLPNLRHPPPPPSHLGASQKCVWVMGMAPAQFPSLVLSPFLCIPRVYSVIVTGEEEKAVKQGDGPLN